MDDLKGTDGGLRELALFAGAGGGILGGKILGWRTVCAVERDAYAAQVLAQRQNDGSLEAFPIWSDVCSFDGRPWRGIIDIISGGFPCQDISCAGKGAGIGGQKSGLWSEFERIISEVRPRFVFVENSPMLTKRGLNRVLGDLASMGYDAEWCVLGANDTGAPHIRKRIWILAYSDSITSRNVDQEKGRRTETGYPSVSSEDVADTDSPYGERRNKSVGVCRAYSDTDRPSWWKTEPDVGRVVDGVAARVDRLKGIGNGQVPAVAALAWNILIKGATK